MTNYSIRLARKSDLKAIRDIELTAATRFKGAGLIDHLLDHHFEQELLKTLIADGQVWVAEPVVESEGSPKKVTVNPVGFAVATVVGMAYLEELDVVPSHGRQGLGRRLVGSVIDWARSKNFPHLTLSTFIDVPWNAPFYHSLGFEKLAKSKWEPELQEIHILEQKLGLPLEQRTFMRLKL